MAEQHPWMHHKGIDGYARLPHGVGWEEKGWAPYDKEPTPEQLNKINTRSSGTASASNSGK